MNPYQADLVIVNFNTRDYLRDCLQSIRKFSGKPEDYRVWVIDNGSSDGSVDMIKSLDFVHGIFNYKNRGYGPACNQGIRAGTGRNIFLLNSDIWVTSGWLSSLCRVLENSPDVAVIGPKLVNPEGLLVGVGVTGANAHPVIRGWKEPNLPEKYDQPLAVLSVCGACMGIKRKLLPELGLFDEHYFHYFEETDYCYNARFHGYKVLYSPDSTVIHRVFGSLQDPLQLQKYYREGERYFNKKWKTFLKDKTQYG